MKKAKFPSKAERDEMRELLSKGPFSKSLPPSASAVDRIKFAICREFVVHKNTSKVTQKALAENIGIDEALMSKITHYQIEDFTIDRLVKFLTVLKPNAEITLRVA